MTLIPAIIIVAYSDVGRAFGVTELIARLTARLLSSSSQTLPR
ncbi:MAG TPA: hypothetical protein PKC13_31545 [Blastocatellia bacterium]|nr:hypothetical protein [Blastocatellia bacterium]